MFNLLYIINFAIKALIGCGAPIIYLSLNIFFKKTSTSLRLFGPPIFIKTIDYYYDNIFYNKAIVDRIKEALKDDKAEEFELVFSAHGLTQRVIDKGDLYQKHILANVEFVKEELKKQNINFKKIDLAYQSRVGPMKWLQPYMEDKIKELGKKVIVYPISFTVDNSETLGELVLEYGELAKEHGIKDYRVAKTPNSNYNFIVALKTIYEDLKLK